MAWWRNKPTVVLASMLVTLAVAHVARAQADGADATATACEGDAASCGRQAFDRGVAAYKRGAWKEALAEFRTAYGVRRYPIVGYNLALTEEKLGMYVESLDHVDEVSSTGPLEPELGKKLAELKTRLAQKVATLHVTTGDAKDVRLFVDGEALPLDAARVNPGSHRIRVVAEGKTRVDREVSAGPGEHLDLTLDAAKPVVTRPAEQEASGKGLSPVWCYALGGATIVTAGVAVWSGIDTLNAKSRFDRDLPGLTRNEAQQRLDDGHARERRTNILFAVSGALAITTVSLGVFAVQWGSERGDRVGIAPAPGGATLFATY